jgi:peptidoglycan/xylan/chitin deacetylase (PgdA/CDA1 family)
LSVPILTYHAVERGPAPLCLAPERFLEQLDLIVEAGATTLTVSQVADGVRAGRLPERALAITFDDGAASVARAAAPALLERGLVATIFCVSGHLGGSNDWASQPTRSPRLELAGAHELAELARAGFEIGSHGLEHVPLTEATPEPVLRREVGDSRERLTEAVGGEVRSFAYPYNVRSRRAARVVAELGYAAACAGGLDVAELASDPLALPRIDVHYLRRPRVFGAVLTGSLPAYLLLRRALAGTRRRFRDDYRAK